MRSFLPLTVYCISLVSLQQLLALPAAERPDTDRSDLLSRLTEQRGDAPFGAGSPTGSDAPPPAQTSRPPKWLPGFLRHPPASGARAATVAAAAASSPGLAWARPAEAWAIERGPTRARRHAHAGSRGGHHHYPHHGQLMRVGCVLGTCQVQNLSHRLYQLIGQSGREDSSPINPKSPHSYG